VAQSTTEILHYRKILCPVFPVDHFGAMKKCNKNIIGKKKGNNCSIPVSLCFKNKLELEPAMLQRNAQAML